jgi:chromosome segregation ATPase
MASSSATLDSATDQLSSAFVRLEKAISAAASRKSASPDVEQMEQSFRAQIEALQAENFQLREENQAVYTQLNTLQSELDDLQSRNDSIAFQIDQQVEQLELMA